MCHQLSLIGRIIRIARDAEAGTDLKLCLVDNEGLAGGLDDKLGHHDGIVRAIDA